MDLILGSFKLEDPEVQADWRHRDLSADLGYQGHGRHDLYRQELTSAVMSAEELFQWAGERVLRYEVFPPSRMKPLVDSPDGHLLPGVTIFQGVFIGPFRLRMADRALDVFQGENENEKWMGFTYGTLKGHAEKGIETFRVVLDKGERKVFFTMEAWSEPGHWLTRLFYPLARHIQKKAGREAMAYMEESLETASSNGTEMLMEVKA